MAWGGVRSLLFFFFCIGSGSELEERVFLISVVRCEQPIDARPAVMFLFPTFHATFYVLQKCSTPACLRYFNSYTGVA